MWITRLQLRNVKSYDAGGQEITFRQGLNLIQGENGAGKSTILEAIGFALFNSAAYAQKRFVREGASGGEVVVSFISGLDGREYEIARGVGGGTTFSLDPDIGQRLTEGVADTFDFIRRHLRVEAETDLAPLFRDAIGVPQGTMTAIFLENALARKDKFDRLLRVAEYERAWERLRDTKNYIDGLIGQNATGQAALRERLGDLPQVEEAIAYYGKLIADDRADLEQIRGELVEVAERLAAFDALKAQLDELDDTLSQHRAEVSRVEGRLEAAQNAVEESLSAGQIMAETEAAYLAYDEAEGALAELRQERDRALEADRARESWRVAQERYDEAAAELAGRQHRLAEREAAFVQRQTLEAEGAVLDEAHEQAGDELAGAKATVKAIKRDLAALDERQALLDSDDARCPVCQRPLDEHTRAEGEAHYKAERERLQQEQDTAKAERKAAQERLAEIDEGRRALEADLDALPTQAGLDDAQREVESAQATREGREIDLAARQNELAQFDGDESRLAEVEENIAAAESTLAASQDAHLRYLGQVEIAARLGERQEELADLQGQRDDLLALQGDAQAHYDAIAGEYEAAAHEDLQAQKGELNVEQGAIEARLVERERNLAQAEGELADLQEKQGQLDALEKDAKRLQTRFEAFDFVRKGVRAAGPKVTGRLVRSVAAEANHIFGDILGDNSMILDWSDDYAISVNYRGEERDFELLSGGEQMAAAIAVRLALLSQVADARFAFFDEPTANLDDARRVQLGERLGAIQSLDQVFVISHDDTFEQESFHVIQVEKVNGVSRVQENATLR